MSALPKGALARVPVVLATGSLASAASSATFGVTPTTSTGWAAGGQVPALFWLPGNTASTDVLLGATPTWTL